MLSQFLERFKPVNHREDFGGSNLARVSFQATSEAFKNKTTVQNLQKVDG